MGKVQQRIISLEFGFYPVTFSFPSTVSCIFLKKYVNEHYSMYYSSETVHSWASQDDYMRNVESFIVRYSYFFSVSK